jgi:hypothetical protein
MKQHNSESGQSIVLVALAMIVLLGFLGLAIDGGRLYTETRQAQNAADGAAMAAARALCGNDPITPEEWAIEAAAIVGYDDNGLDNSVAVAVDYTKEEVEVMIWSEIPATIAQIVYSGGLQTTVRAVGKCFSGGTPTALDNLPFGIVSLATTCGPSLGVTGGGNSGGIHTWNSNMFSNVPSDSGCAINSPNSTGNDGIFANGESMCIYTVGSHDYHPNDKLDDCIIPNANDGLPISDPLASAPVPQCTGPGTRTALGGGAFRFAPGNWDASGTHENGMSLSGSQTAHLEPGIYCISGTLQPSGQVEYRGDGVVLYFVDGGVKTTGNPNFRVTAPNASNCTGTSGSPAASCTFQGMVIFMARDNASTIELGGNGILRIVGTVYGARGTFAASGGGTGPEDSLVWGQIIMYRIINNGNGNLSVWYSAEHSYTIPPTLGLVE